MEMHFRPEFVAPFESLLRAFLAGTAHAPDQYRILPIRLLALGYPALNLYQSIWAFSVVTMTIAQLLLLRAPVLAFGRPQRIVLMLLLAMAYPIAMYTGPRWDTGFLFALGLLLVELQRRGWRIGYFLVLAALSFSRADLALLYAVALSLWNPSLFRPAWAIAAIALPVAVQGLLKYLIYPDARYAVDVVMLQENLNPARLNMAPMLFLLAGSLLLWWRQVGAWLRWLWSQGRPGKGLLLAIAGYLAMLASVAIWSELRLLIPVVPLVLLGASAYVERTETRIRS